MTQRAYFAWFTAFGLMLMSQAPVQADWLTDFDGHSLMGNTGINSKAADGHFSFAVYENNGGNWVSDLFGEMFSGVVNLAGTEVDTAAPYVYFYQVVNSNYFPEGEEHHLDSALVKAVGASVSSVGYLQSTMFKSTNETDAGLKVKLPGNPGLGDADFVPDTPGDGLFSEHTGPTVEFALDANAKPIISAVVESDDVQWIFATQLKPEEYSAIFYYTSDLPPSITTGMIFASQAIGDVVSTTNPVPAPPALALALLGVPFVGVIRRRKVAA